MDPDEQAIRELIAAWLAASRAGDRARVLELMSEDAVFLVPGRVGFRGRSAFAAGMAAMGGATMDGTSTVEEVRVFGDWAYAWTRLVVKVTPAGGGEPIVRAGPTLSVLHKLDGRWVIHRDANLLAPVSP